MSLNNELTMPNNRLLSSGRSILGPTLGLAVPLGIGTMFWGDTALDGKIAGRIIPDETLLAIREISLRRGVTLIDTAEGYGGGSSEARLGRLGYGASGHLLATKFLPTLWRWTPQSFSRSQRASNRRLGINSCELGFIHSPIHPRNPAVWIRGAARAWRAGRLKNLGVSNFNAEQVRAAWALAREEGLPLVANQIMFSLLVFNSPALRETLQACRELGLAVIGYSVLGQGLLSEGLTPESHRRNRLAGRTGFTWEDLAPLRGHIETAARRHGKTMSQVSIQWAISQGVIPLVGTRGIGQLQDTLGALDFRLDPEEITGLSANALAYSTFNRPFGRRMIFLFFISLLMLAYKVSGLFPRKKPGGAM